MNLPKNKYDEYLSLAIDYNKMVDTLLDKVQKVLKRVYTNEQLNLLSIHYNHKTDILDIRFKYPENITTYILNKSNVRNEAYPILAIMPNYKIINVLNDEIVSTKSDTVELVNDCTKARQELNTTISHLLEKLQRKIFFTGNLKYKVEYCKSQLEFTQIIEQELNLLGSIFSEGLINRLVHEIKLMLDNTWNGFEVVENHQTELLYKQLNDFITHIEGKEFK